MVGPVQRWKGAREGATKQQPALAFARPGLGTGAGRADSAPASPDESEGWHRTSPVLLGASPIISPNIFFMRFAAIIHTYFQPTTSTSSTLTAPRSNHLNALVHLQKRLILHLVKTQLLNKARKIIVTPTVSLPHSFGMWLRRPSYIQSSIQRDGSLSIQGT